MAHKSRASTTQYNLPNIISYLLSNGIFIVQLIQWREALTKVQLDSQTCANSWAYIHMRCVGARSTTHHLSSAVGWSFTTAPLPTEVS